jgi:hypothetical protein
MSTLSYNAPWGRKIWLITGFACLFAIGAAISLPLLRPAKNPGDLWAHWISPFAIIAIIGSTSLWMIRRFELSDDAILVRRSFWTNRIPLEVVEAAEVDPDACKGAWKTIGNDGLFAMHGRFRSKRLGKFQAYVTDPKNSVVLKVEGETIVISPESPGSFVKELNRRITRLKGKR